MMHFILCISLNDYDSLAVLLSFHLHLVPKCKVAWWWWGSASDPCSTTSAALPKNECVQAAAVFVIRSLQSSQADRENTAASLHSRALKWFQEALVSTHFPPAPLVYFLKLVTLKKEKKKKRVRKKKTRSRALSQSCHTPPELVQHQLGFVTSSWVKPAQFNPDWTGSEKESTLCIFLFPFFMCSAESGTTESSSC